MKNSISGIVTNAIRESQKKSTCHDLIIRVDGEQLNNFYNGDEARFKNDLFSVCYREYCRVIINKRGIGMSNIYRLRIWQPPMSEAERKEHRESIQEQFFGQILRKDRLKTRLMLCTPTQ